MNLLIVGPPGAGKGTQANYIVEKLSIPHISTGDIFRANISNGTELGIKAKEYMDQGQLVPDEVTNGMVKEKIKEIGVNSGFLFDGYPRTIVQAEAFDNTLSELGINVDAVINLQIDNNLLLDRLTGRRVCPECGTSYHIEFNPPKVDMVCDHDQTGLVHRADDTKEAVGTRLEAYDKQTAPIIDYYGKKGLVVNINANQSVEEVTNEINEKVFQGK